MIGLLNAYYKKGGLEEYQHRYEPLCQSFLENVFPDQKIRIYEIAEGDRPAGPEEASVWVISGSPMSVYDDEDWIQWLVEFVKKAHQTNSKILGICFGHQMVAHALGGEVEKSSKGWGVGIRSFEVLQNKEWMQPQKKEISLLYSHQDQVKILPPGAELLAKSEFCPIEMYGLGNTILCMQGHPEFDKEYSESVLTSRKALLGEETFKSAKGSLNCEANSEDIMSWVRRFLEY